MRRRVLSAYAVLLLALLSGVYIGSRSPYAAAQGDGIGETPIPGRHSEVRAPFEFYVKDSPAQLGWRLAEYKDEKPHAYYKVDAAPGCGEWVVAPGTEAGLVLTPGGKDCQGFIIQFGVLYWFSMPPIKVTPPATDTPAVTPTSPPSDGATATKTPSPTVASVTVSPSPPGGTPTPTVPIMTITPTPMFPSLPSCTVQVLFYWAGDPAQGGLGGKIGDVTWCGACNSNCGLWMLGVDKRTLDGFSNDARERVHQLWATVEAGK